MPSLLWPSGYLDRQSCNQGPRHSCEISRPFPRVRQMHIPSWPRFRHPPSEPTVMAAIDLQEHFFLEHPPAARTAATGPDQDAAPGGTAQANAMVLLK